MTRTRNAAPILLALSVVVGISGEPILGLINGTVTFELKLDEIPKEITWKFYEDKVCEIDSTSDVCFLSYNGRANINKDNGSLTISNLQNNDTGKYTAEIHQTTVKEFTFELEVLGKVSRPNITCNGSEYQATLFCETSGDKYTTLKWDQDEQSVPASHGQISLAIVKRRGSHYTCISSNRVSKAINVFAPEECFLKCCHSHIGLIPAVIFMILIPVTAYGLFKALSKRRKEETPEAEKLMKDNEDPNTNVTELLYNKELNIKMTKPLDNNEPNTNVTELLDKNEPNTKVTEPLDNTELNTNLTATLNNEVLNAEVTTPLRNKELNSKVTAPINIKESNSEESGPSNTKQPNSEEPGPPKPARSFCNNESKGERKSKLNQDNDLDEKTDPGNPFNTIESNKTPPEEHSNATADEKTDPGNPFNTIESNKTPPEEHSNATADEKTDPGNPFNTIESNKTPPEEHLNATADEKTDPGNPFNTIESNKTPPEEHLNATADEKTDPGNPFNTIESNKTPPEEHLNATADEKTDPGNPFNTIESNKTPPEEHPNATADEKTDPGNPFNTIESNKTPPEEHSNATADEKTDPWNPFSSIESTLSIPSCHFIFSCTLKLNQQWHCS
ncbi:sporozoite surface protein 2-like isoform X50 [Polypterus senegalus]|uniref:sporozoite surface protein 2-like isoform X50 n=1 Tax=Polypterus senegalus TaxID=55291 RepID=UPI001962FDE2|nr:sporozoite surface protein 2-like isoform X50 [Polypterus senegalus]